MNQWGGTVVNRDSLISSPIKSQSVRFKIQIIETNI